MTFLAASLIRNALRVWPYILRTSLLQNPLWPNDTDNFSLDDRSWKATTVVVAWEQTLLSNIPRRGTRCTGHFIGKCEPNSPWSYNRLEALHYFHHTPVNVVGCHGQVIWEDEQVRQRWERIHQETGLVNLPVSLLRKLRLRIYWTPLTWTVFLCEIPALLSFVLKNFKSLVLACHFIISKERTRVKLVSHRKKFSAG